MIRKNGNDRWTFDLGAALQVVVILGGVLLFLWRTYGEINSRIENSTTKITETIQELKAKDAATELKVGTLETRQAAAEKAIDELKVGVKENRDDLTSHIVGGKK